MIFQTVIGGYSTVELVSWATGSYSQIAAMLEAHYKGKIDISNYWSVGDMRTITLDAIEATSTTSAMAAQTVQLVLLNAGGETMVSSLYGQSECAYVVGFKNCLSGVAPINSSAVSNYSTSTIRTFLNQDLYQALPSDLRGIMKYFVNKSTIYNSDATLVSCEDYVSLASAVEVFGYPDPLNVALSGEGSQFDYYKTQANRVKTVNSTASDWWTRSAYNTAQNTYVYTNGSENVVRSDYLKGIAPIFVI